MRLLFLCVANSARSILAEGVARHMLGPGASVQSAGSRPAGVNPLALAALKEVGIDTGGLTSKIVDAIDLGTVDLVITLCADEVCPVTPPGVRKLHWPLPDPAAVQGSDEERLAAFRRVRDDLIHRLRALQATHAI